jgi:hypothetical protein
LGDVGKLLVLFDTINNHHEVKNITLLDKPHLLVKFSILCSNIEIILGIYVEWRRPQLLCRLGTDFTNLLNRGTPQVIKRVSSSDLLPQKIFCNVRRNYKYESKRESKCVQPNFFQDIN